jgi:hypothetical protein
MRTAALVALAHIVSAQAALSAELRTTQCGKYGQPEIVFEVQSSAIPEADRQWVIKTVEERVAGGSRFKAGETLQLGWMINQFAEGPDGTLRLQEPDMRSMPFAFVDRLDNTLRHLRYQKDTVESFTEPLDLVFPSVRQSVFVPPAYKSIFRYAMQRHKPEGTDSGWLMTGPADPKADMDLSQHTRVSLYELVRARPELIPLLALPPGVLITKDFADKREYFFEDRALTVRPTSFLAKVDAQIRRANYHKIIGSHVYSTWKIPKSAPAGTQCEGVLKLAADGKITGLSLGDCTEENGFRKSIETAVEKASPVPRPTDPSDYIESLRIVFAKIGH